MQLTLTHGGVPGSHEKAYFLKKYWMQPLTQASADGYVIAIPFLGIAQAGFPSPATDYLRERVSLDKMLIKHPSSTFLCRVDGDRLKDHGITDGDLAIVDRSLPVALGRVVVISFRGELVLAKVVEGKHSTWMFESANPLHPLLDVFDAEDMTYWGTITYAVKKLT